MGMIIDVTEKVSVEVRRESFYIHDSEAYPKDESREHPYEHLEALKKGLEAVEQSKSYKDWKRVHNL